MYLPDSTLLRGGTYRIVRHISSGGFGNTYEGVHTVMDAQHFQVILRCPCNFVIQSHTFVLSTDKNLDISEKGPIFAP